MGMVALTDARRDAGTGVRTDDGPAGGMAEVSAVATVAGGVLRPLLLGDPSGVESGVP